MPRLHLVAALEGHDGRAWGVAWSPDGEETREGDFASESHPSTFSLSLSPTHHPTHTHTHTHTHGSTGSTLASCGADRTVRLWTRTGAGGGQKQQQQWTAAATLDGPASRAVRCLAWSPCGARLAAASFDATTVVWERAGGPSSSSSSWIAAAILQGHESEVKSAAWSPGGTHLASAARDKSVWVWEAVPDGAGGTEYECADVKQGHTADVKAVAWHPAPERVAGCAAPGGGVLVSASYDETIRVWADAGDEWVCAQVLGVGDGGHAGTVWCLSFEAPEEGRPARLPRLASGGGDGSVRVWACPPRRAGASPDDDFAWGVAQALDGAHGDRPVYAVAWAQPVAGRRARLATGGGDDAVRLWEETEDAEGGGGGAGSLVQVASAAASPPTEVNGLAWCPAGRDGGCLLAAACDDGVVRVWRVVEDEEEEEEGGDGGGGG
jgi:cytosolic iron-sulfur protein assembly protein CIAO1